MPLLDPQEIPPLEIWGHFAAKGLLDAIVEHLALWEDTLLQRSTDLEVAELLDRLNELMPDLEAPFRPTTSMSRQSGFWGAPFIRWVTNRNPRVCTTG